MSHDIRLFKLVTGETVIGKWAADGLKITAVASLQNAPAQQGNGMQLVILPYGYPFETAFIAEIDTKHIIFQHPVIPEELKTKYLEILTNITIVPNSSIITDTNAPGTSPIITK